jgi:hypothetical protein
MTLGVALGVPENRTDRNVCATKNEDEQETISETASDSVLECES